MSGNDVEQNAGQNNIDAGDAAKNDQDTANLLYGEKPEGEKPEGEKPEGEKPEGEKPEGEKPEGEEADADYDLGELPEGFELDEEVAGEFKSAAKELGLDQEGVNKLVELQSKLYERQLEAHQKTIADWGNEVKADKEIGGDKLAENLAIARKAVDTFGGEELKTLLNSTGLGNHPAVVRFALKVGKAISEDGFVRGLPPSGVNSDDPASRMFPDMK